MSKSSSKQFVLSNGYQLGAVDRWWAGLLQTGAKMIDRVEWDALGDLVWRLKVYWNTVPEAPRLNVGHPSYTDMDRDEVKEFASDVLSDFEEILHDFTLVEERVKQWGLGDILVDAPEPYYKVTFPDDLPEVEKLIATEFLWAYYWDLKKRLAQHTTKLRELDQELKARDASDYFAVVVDRGMLRSSFIDQIGYDNEMLFEDEADIPFAGE